jgi:hypothetical protein
MIPEQVKIMQGLKCCLASIGYGDVFKIEFGQRMYYDEKRFHGEWSLVTYSCGWRVMKDEKILCGYYDAYETSDKIVRILEGRILKEILQPTKYDLSLIFDNNYRADFWGQTNYKNHHSLFVYGPQEQYFELRNDGSWSVDADDKYLKNFEKSEKLKNEHSENFHERWFGTLPVSDNEFRCGNCAYFHGVTGQFYFWDYGLCSNAESPQDGRVVGIKSYCNEFSRTLKRED